MGVSIVQDKSTQADAGGLARRLYLLAGIVTVLIGLIGAGSGWVWGDRSYEYLMSIEFTYYLQSYLPYYPFVPFFPIFILMLGAFLLVRSRQ
jgi:hypothetical protein